MAFSAHKDPDQLVEHISDDRVLDDQAEKLADLIKNSKHFVAFTGAGVSTSAGIPDFRGPEGVWTMRAQGKLAKAKTSSEKACPTVGHMALKSLESTGMLKFLISQNTDGLHRRSGFPPEKLAELHGNTNLELCRRCGKQYFRDFRTSRNNGKISDHTTGRFCDCGAELHDSIIHFSESLPKEALNDGFRNAKQADLMLVLGSSLTVSPANDMPQLVAERGKNLVVVNLQKTPLDAYCKLRIFGKTDEIMMKVMGKLGLQLEPWKLIRHIQIRCQIKNDEMIVTVSGIEADHTPASILARVDMASEPLILKQREERNEDFIGVFHLNGASSTNKKNLNTCLHFIGHFNEPPVEIRTSFVAHNELQTFRMEFDPQTGTWDVRKL